MKKIKKHYIIAGILSILTVVVAYIYPFMLANMNIAGNDIALEQYVIAGLLLLPAIALFIKKPKSLWIYSYPVLLFVSIILAFSGGDALGAGLVLMFVSVPVAVIYSILVFTKVIK